MVSTLARRGLAASQGALILALLWTGSAFAGPAAADVRSAELRTSDLHGPFKPVGTQTYTRFVSSLGNGNCNTPRNIKPAQWTVALYQKFGSSTWGGATIFNCGFQLKSVSAAQAAFGWYHSLFGHTAKNDLLNTSGIGDQSIGAFDPGKNVDSWVVAGRRGSITFLIIANTRPQYSTHINAAYTLQLAKLVDSRLH
jgi:hypothetical protein